MAALRITEAELSNCDRDHLACTTENIYCPCPLWKKFAGPFSGDSVTSQADNHWSKTGSQSVFPGPVAPASPGSVLGMQILRPYPRLTESEMLEVGPKNVCFKQPPGDSDVCSS